MKNKKYWKERFLQMEAQTNRTSVEYYNQVADQYYQANKELDAKIRSWQQRLANNNGVTMSEARKLLTANELAEFKWDVNEYIKYGMENKIDGKWMKQLENASSKFHISRYESLKIQTQQSLEVLFGNQLDGVDSFIKNTYRDTYYHSMFELQKGYGVGFDIASVDNNRLQKIISKPWVSDGKNFSERIWGNKQKLINELHTELAQMCIMGRGPDRAIKNIAKKMKVSKTNAGALVMTESAFFASASQKECFNDLDVEKYEILATLDHLTSEICQELDGKVFDMKDYAPGSTAPPFHVRCRTCTVPWFDDDFTIGTRAARDEDGKTYHVPGDTKYKEWKDSFVDGGDKRGLKPIEESDTIKLPKNKDSEVFKKLKEENYNGLHKILENTSEMERNVWVKMERQLTVLSATSNNRPCCYRTKGIKMNVTNDSKGSTYSKPYQTTFHEFGHNIDYIANVDYGNGYSQYPYSYTYKDNVFGKTLKQEINQRVNAVATTIKDDFNKHVTDVEWLHKKGYISIRDYNFYKKYGDWEGAVPKCSKSMVYKTVENEIRAMDKMKKANLSDIVEGATGGRINGGFGHGASYWKKGEYKLSTEAFAEMFDSSIANVEQLEKIKEYFPESYIIYMEILESIMKGVKK